ncbi:MAG TPA: glycosyltransferase family 2 protein [Acidimicrobiales bacterium]|nr:glycosyltransferase family 2 protein [Acidimicrobiales bacterium]
MNPATAARVGVVIVTYASGADIGHALGSLPTAAMARVVVVDNASPDDTVAIVRALDLPNVEVVEQDNVGFGAGNDAGRARLPATAEFVLFLNPDCVIQGSDIERLVGYLDAHPTCALVGPALRDADGSLRTPGGTLPTPMTELRPLLPAPVGRFLVRRQLDGATARSGPVGYVEGACMLARLDAFDAVGGFDRRYFLCFEEMDLAHRLSDAGWSVDLCLDATATHAAQQSRAQVRAFSLYHQFRSQRLYLERWHGEKAAQRYAAAAGLCWWLRKATRNLSAADYRVLRAASRKAQLPG